MEFKGSKPESGVEPRFIEMGGVLQTELEISAKKNIDRMIELSEVVREALVASAIAGHAEAMRASHSGPGRPDLAPCRDVPEAKRQPAALKLPLTKNQDLSMYLDRAHLTDKQRQCVSLRYEYGLNPTQIAKHLDKHRSTVTELLNAADLKMKRLNSTVRPKKLDA